MFIATLGIVLFLFQLSAWAGRGSGYHSTPLGNGLGVLIFLALVFIWLIIFFQKAKETGFLSALKQSFLVKFVVFYSLLLGTFGAVLYVVKH